MKLTRAEFAKIYRENTLKEAAKKLGGIHWQSVRNYARRLGLKKQRGNPYKLEITDEGGS